MRYILTFAILQALTLLAGTFHSLAQTVPMNMTTTSVPFLSICPDAVAAGIGDQGIATRPDAYSGLHNGAKASFAKEPGAIGIGYTPWLRNIVQDMYLLSAAGYHRLDENQAVSASLRYFNLGDVQISDYGGNKLTTTHPREYSLDLGYSRKLSDRLGIGLTLRYIHSDLASGEDNGTNYKAGKAIAADVSLYYSGLNQQGQGWAGGLALNNLGSKISYTNDATARDFLPASLGIGLAYTGIANEDNRWTLTGEASKLLVPSSPSDSAGLAGYHALSVIRSWGKSFSNNAYRFAIAGEYGYKDFFYLSLGYTAQTRPAGDLKYLTTGVGLKFSSIGLDFSYLVPSGSGIERNPLSDTFRLGIDFTF